MAVKSRTGVTPAERPTEWTTAIIGIATAVTAYQTDHNLTALVAIVAAFLPTIVTYVVSLYDRAKGNTAVTT